MPGLAGANCFGQERDRRLGRADRSQAELRVELRAGGVEDPHDDAPDAVPALQDLADHEVRVVAVGRDDGRLRLGDAGLLEDVPVHAVPDDEAALPGAEPRERVLVLVDAR